MNRSLEKQERKINIRPLTLAAILGSLGGFAPLSIDMYLPALPHLAEDLNTKQSLAQLSITFFLFGLVIGQLIVGPISDSKGRRKPLLIGLAIYAVSSLCCVFTTSIEIFVALRFIQGLSGASGIVLSRAILRDYFSGRELTKIFAMLSLIQGAAPVLAPVLGGVILFFVPWKGVFVFLTFVGLIMFFIVLFKLPESLDESMRTKGQLKQTLSTFKYLLFERSFIGFALAIGFLSVMLFAYISSSSFVFQNVYGVSAQMFSVIFAINGVGIVIGSQIAGRLVGRFSELKLLAFGLSMSFVGTIMLFIMLSIQAELYFVLPPLFIAISTIGIVNTTGQSLALQKQGKVAGSASGLMGVLQFTLAGSLSPLTGLGNNPAVSMGIVMVCGSILAILIYFFIIRPAMKSVES